MVKVVQMKIFVYLQIVFLYNLQYDLLSTNKISRINVNFSTLKYFRYLKKSFV